MGLAIWSDCEQLVIYQINNEIITVYAIISDLLKAIAQLSLLNLPLCLVVLRICHEYSG
ncbi:hypothetical protein [Desmonostoc muscorum]|uniref:Uncharacterized protein n=1 Tax=Desmonostoc muscorum LEGE 12446 TaxID=1828758 RepID=A0A8J6ZWT0_DESMC|nr:hypothetical protein [Desmonostoc muscorum]